MENKQYELDVYALVNSLMTKLGITYPIDYLLEWYNHTDKVPTPFISPMIKDSVNASVKHDNTIETNIPECAKTGYFPWNDVLASMYTMPEKVKITEKVCPNCGEKLVDLYFSSPVWTWKALCGRGGRMTICTECPQQVEFGLEIMN